ncbi:hypothetical protein [Rhodococcus sp. (in: high G+C Gram-positive bacteria)]|uniref:hypothetical protein n=1 Tax=Rhodococcus sp. TaxID=1831 RepID=UPI003B8A7286
MATADVDAGASRELTTASGLHVQAGTGDPAVPRAHTRVAGDLCIKVQVDRRPAAIGDCEDRPVPPHPRSDRPSPTGRNIGAPEIDHDQIDPFDEDRSHLNSIRTRLAERAPPQVGSHLDSGEDAEFRVTHNRRPPPCPGHGCEEAHLQ